VHNVVDLQLLQIHPRYRSATLQLVVDRLEFIPADSNRTIRIGYLLKSRRLFRDLARREYPVEFSSPRPRAKPGKDFAERVCVCVLTRDIE